MLFVLLVAPQHPVIRLPLQRLMHRSIRPPRARAMLSRSSACSSCYHSCCCHSCCCRTMPPPLARSLHPGLTNLQEKIYQSSRTAVSTCIRTGCTGSRCALTQMVDGVRRKRVREVWCCPRGSVDCSRREDWKPLGLPPLSRQGVIEWATDLRRRRRQRNNDAMNCKEPTTLAKQCSARQGVKCLLELRFLM